jgi:hypothetical protein
MGQISDLTELTTPAGTEQVVVRTTDATDKDKRLGLSKLGVLNLAQSWSAVQTFAGGISMGTNQGATWSPVVTGSSSNPTITYTGQVGYYTKIGNVVLFTLQVTINTISGGSGDARISLPLTSVNVVAARTRPTVYTSGVAWPNSGTMVAGFISNNVAYMLIGESSNNGGGGAVQISNLAAGDTIAASGLYFV